MKRKIELNYETQKWEIVFHWEVNRDLIREDEVWDVSLKQDKIWSGKSGKKEFKVERGDTAMTYRWEEYLQQYCLDYKWQKSIQISQEQKETYWFPQVKGI